LTNKLGARSGAERCGVGEGGVEAEVGPVEEGGKFGKAEGEAFGGGGAEGDMAEFAAGAGGLAIEVEVGVGDGEDFSGLWEVSDQIEHGAVAGEPRGAERKAERGAKMVLKLAGDGAFDGPMAGIVDPRGHFVGEELALMLEKFDGEHSDVFQRFEDAVGDVFRGALDGGLEARGGRDGKAEDAAAVVIFDERVDGGFAIARTDREHGELARERDKTLEDQFHGRHLRLGFRDVLRGAKDPLTFAVIAHARGFQNGRKTDSF
jgi:hypothetical protein